MTSHPKKDWSHDDYEIVKWQLIRMHSISFAFAAVVYIAFIVVYNEEPSGAPNKSRGSSIVCPKIGPFPADIDKNPIKAETLRINQIQEQNIAIINANDTKIKQYKARLSIFMKSVKG